jgi:hydroxymethylglutaryl-CoA synthase
MTMTKESAIGVSGLALYVPRYRVQLEDWCRWTDSSWGKVQAVVGRSFRVPGPRENAYTMAAGAVMELIRRYDIDPRRVGFLGLGTESSTDNSAGAVIVRGMVDRALRFLGKPELARDCEVPEFKHACLGGVYALKGAARYLAFDGADRLAIVVSSDIAEYERGSTGEQTQGAGAVAMLVERDPKLFTIDLHHGGSASHYRGPDFRKPFARHFDDRYARGLRRPGDYPVFSGKYSTFAYLDETARAVEAMLDRVGEGPLDFYDGTQALFFHRPYHMMPVQSMAFLYTRALAGEARRAEEFSALCTEAGVTAEDVRAEVAATPDLFSRVLDGQAEDHPYPATNAVSGLARKSKAFKDFVATKMSLGADAMMELGNLYTGALPAWIAAGFDQAAADGVELTGKRLAIIGYGSGDAAEALPIYPVAGWQEAAQKIRFAEALSNPVDLRQEEYEALHDGEIPASLDSVTHRGFRVRAVGERYEPSFQDLCVEYYDFVA